MAPELRTAARPKDPAEARRGGVHNKSGTFPRRPRAGESGLGPVGVSRRRTVAKGRGVIGLSGDWATAGRGALSAELSLSRHDGIDFDRESSFPCPRPRPSPNAQGTEIKEKRSSRVVSKRRGPDGDDDAFFPSPHRG